MARSEKFPSHLVLDLDETLIHSIHHASAAEMQDVVAGLPLQGLRSQIFQINVTARSARERNDPPELWWVVKRPHLAAFLEFCFAHFETVSVWTAADQLYAEAIVEEIFRDVGRPYLLWHRAMCERDELENLTKPLAKLAKVLNTSVDNMCILDDRSTSFKDNRESAIWMPVWAPKPTKESLEAPDTILAQIMVMWSLHLHNEFTSMKRVRGAIRQAQLGFVPFG